MTGRASAGFSTDNGDARIAAAGIYVAVCGTCGYAACAEPARPGVKTVGRGRVLVIPNDEHGRLRATCNKRPACSGRGSKWVFFRRAEP